ncbi:MAG: hypothetical protein L3J83_09740 [Proteobacteria bacterium]|nr:hypothetical protein [Pseudomonadota bacterium]
MKTNKILSTAGICPKDSTILRSYCNLLQASLTHKWLFADDFVNSHVCIVLDGYLINMETEKKCLSQIIIVINKSNEPLNINKYKYQVSYPLTASGIKDVLNRISTEVDLKPLNLTQTKPETISHKFKFAFAKIRKSFFNRSSKKIKQTNKEQFISRITQKINSNTNRLPRYKIVLLGSPGSGKTTAIQSISNGKALNSDVSATDSVARDKAKTTVGIDYAEVLVPDGTGEKNRKIALFGTPGQVKFNFIWDVVGKNADAFIILLDMSRPEPLSYLKFYYKFLREELSKTSQVYCTLTHCENCAENIQEVLNCIKRELPKLSGVYQIDAREKEDITTVLTDICPQTENQVNTNCTISQRGYNNLRVY